MSTSTYDVLDPSLGRDLYPFLARLRHEGPVLRSPQLHGVVLLRHADVEASLRSTNLSSGNTVARLRRLPPEQRDQLDPLIRSISHWIGNGTPEAHRRLQSILIRYFTPKTVESFRPVAQDILDRLLDQLALDEVELVSELAYPLPAAVIGHMLGVPPDNETRVLEWSRHLTALFIHHEFEQLLESQRSMLEMADFMRQLVEERRREPREDLLTLLSQAQAEGKLDEDELIANCALLLFAGHETTARLLVHGTVALLEHPDQLALLRNDPSLRANAIEEMLRYDGPAGVVARSCSDPLEIGGTTVEPNEMMFLCLVSANHDEAVFEDPDRFDIERPGVRSKALAFGTGIHHCLGAALARLEADVFFETMLRRFSRIEALDPEPEWIYSPPFNRGLSSYRVRLTPAAAG